MFRTEHLAWLLGMLLIAPLLGQEGVDAKSIDQLIAQLDDKSFKVRQDAMRKLRQAGPGARPHLLRALKEETLSLETRQRLRQLADELLAFRAFEPADCPADAEKRIGYQDRIFVIDNEGDYQRYQRVLPSIPKVDLKSRLLVVALSSSWPVRRFLTAVEEGETLVVQLEQEWGRKPLEHFARYRVLTAHVVAWSGPIRVEVNGRPEFEVRKGKRHEEEVARQWQEIRRLYEGGKPTISQRVAAARRLWDDGSRDDKIAAELSPHTLGAGERENVFVSEFRRLADMRATSVVADIFKMLENMKESDPAAAAATKALAALGTPEVVAGCAKAIKSTNPFVQRMGLDVAWCLKDPALRPAFLHALKQRPEAVVRSGVVGLWELGLTKDDVPALIPVLERGDFFEDFQHTVALTAFYLGSLGADAEAALPALEKLRSFRPLSVQEAANAAIKKIKSARRAP